MHRTVDIQCNHRVHFSRINPIVSRILSMLPPLQNTHSRWLTKQSSFQYFSCFCFISKHLFKKQVTTKLQIRFAFFFRASSFKQITGCRLTTRDNLSWLFLWCSSIHCFKTCLIWVLYILLIYRLVYEFPSMCTTVCWQWHSKNTLNWGKKVEQSKIKERGLGNEPLDTKVVDIKGTVSSFLHYSLTWKA